MLVLPRTKPGYSLASITDAGTRAEIAALELPRARGVPAHARKSTGCKLRT